MFPYRPETPTPPSAFADEGYGCDESIPGNCRCDEDNSGQCGTEHPYEHICTLDEFHDGRHYCCCGRNWVGGSK